MMDGAMDNGWRQVMDGATDDGWHDRWMMMDE